LLFGFFQEQFSASDLLLCLGHLSLQLCPQESLLVQIPAMLAELADDHDGSYHNDQTEQGAEDDGDQLCVCQRLLFNLCWCRFGLGLGAFSLSFGTLYLWLYFGSVRLD